MTALIIGIVFILFAVFAVLPGPGWGLGWWDEVLLVLRGGIPLVALFVGMLAVLIGLAEIKDRLEEKRENDTAEEDKEQDEGNTSGD